jgi:pyruvate/2-oxoglutarate dehydrogenase complex dihydrolipoamide acyltransferase (E2) component
VAVIYCDCPQTFVERENFVGKEAAKLLAKILLGVSNVSNLYMCIDMFTPVLNGQEVGMFGIGRIVKELVVKDDNSTAIRTMAYFSLLYGHMIIDGALASRFLGSLAEVIENESLLKEVLKSLKNKNLKEVTQ